MSYISCRGRKKVWPVGRARQKTLRDKGKTGLRHANTGYWTYPLVTDESYK